MTPNEIKLHNRSIIFLSRKSAVGSRKSEVGSRKSEVGSQKSEVGSRNSEVGSWKSKVPPWLSSISITALFNNMRTLKFKAQPTNAFFVTVNHMFGGSFQLPAVAGRAVIKSLSTVQTTKQCSAVALSVELHNAPDARVPDELEGHFE